ncbi:MAG: flagellar motor switch protein FliN [Bdellovibrionales bacterium]|nr:flagellar motor switch protein FliN [Bdellovibrionales bacterium]
MADDELTQEEIDNVLGQNLEKVAAAADEVVDAAEEALEGALPERPAEMRTVDFIKEVPLAVTVEVGRARMTIQDLLQLGQGSVVELAKLAGDPLDIYINGYCVARGEAVIVNEKFGVRLLEVIDPEDRIQHLG